MSHDPPAPSPLAPGYRLDRYELLCPVAQGGMASVWLAKLRAKHGFEKLVAIKTILPQLASDVRFQQMFLDEARLASKIDHANVAHVLDLGDEHGVLYLVMEWIDGDSLSKLQRAAAASGVTIPSGIALRIMADVCAGLHAAHELCDANGASLGVVHRDVSPQNVLLSTRGIVKVIDFGIAKARDRVAGETSTGSLKGKIQFMAPEQAIGKPIDRRADVWAAGAVLYSLLGGQPPYDGPNQFATLHQIASGEPPPRLPARVPQAIAEIAYRALLHDPDGRFATAAEMQRALEAAMVSTKNAAASADVAAFAGEHLSSRAEQRKKSVDMAIRAATERARVERILTTPDSSSNPVRVAADVQIDEEIIPFPSTRSQVATLPERAPPPDNDALLKLVATSPSLRASSSPLIGAPPLASHRRAVLSAVAVAITVVAAAVVSLRPRHAPSAEDPAPTAASAPIFEAIPAPSIAPTDVASPSPSAPPSPPSAATSALAAPAITHAPDAHRASSPRRPAPPPASASAKSPARPAPKERIDDGF